MSSERTKRATDPDGREYDEDWRVIAMTLVNVKWLLERDGELKITWPEGHIKPEQLAPVLAAAA
jgi:hypothetical protein